MYKYLQLKQRTADEYNKALATILEMRNDYSHVQVIDQGAYTVLVEYKK